MMSEKYRKAFEAIQGAKKILLVTHNSPDGDALSSMSILIELMTIFQKDFFAYCFDEPPFQFNFLPHVEKIKHSRKDFSFPEYDLIISVDCGSLNRTKLQAEINHKKPNQINLEFDHHPKIDDFAEIEIRNTKASSTSEVLYDFIRANKIKINKNLANSILTGIMTDTGNFLFPNTTDKSIKIASKMLLYGARFPAILENTWRNKSLSAMKIWGKAINNLRINTKYNIAYSVLTFEDVTTGGATEEELEGLPGFLANLHNVHALLWLREQESGIIKGSLRTSHPDIDISKLAQSLGGGGHPKASGFRFNGKLVPTKTGWRVE